MKTSTAAGLHPALRGFPGMVLELSADGRVVESNGRMEAALERGVLGHPLADVLDEASRVKLRAILAGLPSDPDAAEDRAPPWELILEGRDTVHPHAFHPVRDEPAGRMWLVECPRDPRVDGIYAELAAVNAEQAATQRQLAREKSRLSRALEELEREFAQNERLSLALQAQNEEMEAQNEELLAMTEELHSGQEQLMTTNHQLERRSRELQVAIGARNRFYAAMSHELRTPINAVMGYNDLLLAAVYGALNEQQELAVERAQRAARHLRELVDDVLDLSRLEAGFVEPAAEEVHPGPLVEELFDTLRPLAADAGSELRLTEGGDVVLRTDPRRLRQILLNLVSNGIKYGGGSPVWVSVRAVDGGGAVIEVTDGGGGIDAADQARIFDEFVQLGREDNVDGPAREGTGLGLPIARRLAGALGGTLEVTSSPGVGTTFRLTLPGAAPRPGASTDTPTER